MIEFYPHIRQIHILTVILSGGLFALRGVFALAGARWPHAAPVRYLSYTIDTTLLTAALMLVSILTGAMFANGRPEESRVGKACVSTCISRGSPDNDKKQNYITRS